MHISLIKRAAVLGASAFALAASAAFSAEWTSFQVGTLNSYTFTYAHRDDGQFILGEGGEIGIQTTYGSPGITPLANTSNILLDPAAIAVKSATVGIIAAGGPLATSNLYLFDPSTPGTSISATPLANLQNYVIKYWKHPTSAREGWLVIGGNGTVPVGGFYGANTLSFVSLDGSKVGEITGDLSDYSGGLDVDSLGNVFVALSGLSPAEEGKVLKFTADQVDAAVLALISDTPAPLSKAAATLIFEADASASLAVDSAGRLWIGGYPISHIQAYDPVTSVQRRFTPDHAALANAAGSPSYSVRSYTRNGAGFVSFLASDSFYNDGSALTLGYKPVSELNIRSVQFTATAQTVSEAVGTVNLTVTITPAPTAKVTVPLIISGTATKGKDYTAISPTSLTFDAANTSRTIPVKVINDVQDEDNDNETIIVTLGTPVPVAQAGLGAIGTERFTLTITDDDVKPQIAAVQNFGTLKVGGPVSYQVINTGSAATKWTASGLPPGLKINPLTGLITGTPVTPGEYDQVWITATNAHGVSTSVAYVLNVAAFPAPAVGTFIGLIDRAGTLTNGLGARVTLVTTSKSTYSGKIEIGKSSIAIKGDLNNTGTHPAASASFKNGTTKLTLNFTLDAVTGELSGTLVPTPEAPSGNVSGALAVNPSLSGWRAQTATDLTGVHNFFAAVPGGPASTVPEGTSYGSAKVSATGITTIAGVAADGSVFTSSSPLAINGDLILYQILYKVQGSFTGVLNIANDTAHSMTGSITWSKPSQGTPTSDKLYATGWAPEQDLTVRGGKYRPAVGATLPMNAAVSAGNNARIVLQDGGIEALGANPTTIQFRIASATSLVVPAPHKLTLKNDTGLLTGSITLGSGAARKSFNIQALLVPDETTADPFDSAAQGYFILPVSSTVSRAGMVVIERAGL